MTNLNNVVLQGRMTSDAVDGLRRSASGVAYGSFTLATSKNVKNGEQWEEKTSFIKCKAFGKSFESASKHMSKGSLVIVNGSLEVDEWEGKDGNRHKEVVIVVDKIYPTYKSKGSDNSERKVAFDKGFEELKNAVVKGTDDFPEDIPF